MTIEQRLRDLASKATRGPWRTSYTRPHSKRTVVEGPDYGTGLPHRDTIARDVRIPDAAYIASLDPSTVLRLLDVVEAARARIVYEGADAEPCWRCGGGGSRCEERLGELETCRCCGGRGSHCAVVQSKNGTVACVDHQSKPDQYVAECQSEPELYAALSRLDEGEK